MTNVTEIDMSERMRREDAPLVELINQWKATYHKYLAVIEERVEMADRIAALEGQIVRYTPTTFLGLVKVLQMAHMIMSARDAEPDSYIGEGPATILIRRAIDAVDHENGLIGN